MNLAPFSLALHALDISEAEALRFYRLLAEIRPFDFDTPLYDGDIVNLYRAAVAAQDGDE